LFLNNRHYDPTTGVFVSVDPLVTKTMEPYIYGAANPVTYSDPSGLCAGAQVFDKCILPQGKVVDQGTSRFRTPAEVDFTRIPPPTDSCRRDPSVCGADPGTSGLGFRHEVRLIEEIGQLPVDEFYDLALNPEEIKDRELGFLDWSNDGCSNSPDSVGGTSLLGPCARHDFSYRNLKAWSEHSGEDLFGPRREGVDERFRQGIFEVCDLGCDWVANIYWAGVNGFGDGDYVPWNGWVPGW